MCRNVRPGILSVLPRDLLPEIPSIRTMPMIGTQFRRVLALAALILATASPAAAAPDVWACQRYRTELANLNASASTASALQSEVARLQTYYRSLNCEGGKFLFFDTRPRNAGPSKRGSARSTPPMAGATARWWPPAGGSSLQRCRAPAPA
ncbi:hypothetical protein GCM10025880_25860 [Methylorubrum aminovorans]|uniref:hypothetical protein n=1 Tax=Methylorubrum aminovorans TaxID=269069 RepID=UPI0023E9342E|nr:hypothetical protein GCM10025880_25860 [Methylorubrum aminovorans]